MDFAWQITRNSFEAAALNSLQIGAKPITMVRNTSDAHDITEWNLRPISDDGLYDTSALRQSFNNGKPQGLLATETLHPYLIACRVMHNRSRLLDAQKGRPMRSVEEAPGSWILEHGNANPSDLLGAYIETTDFDRALGLIGLGSAIISITGPKDNRSYRLTRLALPSKLPGIPRTDNGIWYERHRDQTVFPDHATSHFGRQIHALHCLRELGKRKHANRFIIVRHRTPFHKGAAFKDGAAGEVIHRVRRTLGVKL